MNEIKNMLVIIIIFLLCDTICFFAGYLLSDRIATKRINEANRQLTEQQQKYDKLIGETEQRISDIREQLLGKISDNGKAATELSRIVEQIRKQKLDVEI